MKQENTQLRLCADPFRSKLVYLKIKNEVIPKKKKKKKNVHFRFIYISRTECSKQDFVKCTKK